jgi:POT family proton-dependent oligopeptide transporter
MAYRRDTPDSTLRAPRTPAFFGHPVGLAYLAFMEAFERFSFYGMQALLVLYMTSTCCIRGTSRTSGVRGPSARAGGRLRADVAQALSSEIFGLYAGFCSFTPVFGGIIGDRLLGQKRAVLAGGVMMAAGHFMMAFEATFLPALLLLMTGCGMLKGNISAQVGTSTWAGPRREAAFQIFYVAANVGRAGRAAGLRDAGRALRLALGDSARRASACW